MGETSRLPDFKTGRIDAPVAGFTEMRLRGLCVEVLAD